MRIFLIGFMGSGKTYWGKILSRRMELPFYDLDTVIEGVENKSVKQIFNDDGEEYFRLKEQEALEAIIDDHEEVIVSTGGGTPCFFNNIDLMKKNGKVIWLNTSVDVLVQRLMKEKQSRPLIKNISDTELKIFIVKKMQDRRLYYEQADITLKEELISIDSLLKQIQDA
jgi:shikimate kinase